MAIPYVSSYEALPFSDVSKQIGLVANVGQNFTVPGNGTMKYVAVFSFNATANIFVGNNTTATTPPGGTTTSLQYVSFRPDRKFVSGGDVLSFTTPDTTGYVGVELYSIPS